MAIENADPATYMPLNVPRFRLAIDVIFALMQKSLCIARSSAKKLDANARGTQKTVALRGVPHSGKWH
jgi:hypothetical protein